METPNGLEDAIIEELHLTKFTKRNQLRTQLIARGYFLKDRPLRKHVEKLITEGKYCIQSSSKGYSLIITPEDLEEAKKYLQKKAFKLHHRVKCLEDNYKLNKLSKHQLTLFA